MGVLQGYIGLGFKGKVVVVIMERVLGCRRFRFGLFRV